MGDWDKPVTESTEVPRAGVKDRAGFLRRLVLKEALAPGPCRTFKDRVGETCLVFSALRPGRRYWKCWQINRDVVYDGIHKPGTWPFLIHTIQTHVTCLSAPLRCGEWGGAHRAAQVTSWQGPWTTFSLCHLPFAQVRKPGLGTSPDGR